eukprot:1043230-Prorocentrum_lima.AAC.1
MPEPDHPEDQPADPAAPFAWDQVPPLDLGTSGAQNDTGFSTAPTTAPQRQSTPEASMQIAL